MPAAARASACFVALDGTYRSHQNLGAQVLRTGGLGSTLDLPDSELHTQSVLVIAHGPNVESYNN